MNIPFDELLDFGERERTTALTAYRSLLTAGFCLLGGAAVFIGVFFATGAASSEFGFGHILLSLACLVASFIVFGVAHSKKKGYQKRLLAALRTAVGENVYKKVRTEPNRGLPLSFIMSTGFFSKPDRYIGRNHSSAIYGGIPFECADFDLQRREKRTDGNGHVTVYYVSYARGKMYRFSFERMFKESLLVIEKEAVSDLFSSKKNRVEMESIAFNDKFRVHASLKEFAFYILTPQVQESILMMEDLNGGRFHCLLRDNELIIAMTQNSGSLFPTPDLNKPLTKEVLAALSQQFLFPATAVEKLGLNTTKYKRNAGTGGDIPNLTKR